MPPDSEDNFSFRGRTGTGTRMSLRRRSPSPVVTGKVLSFRDKFENYPKDSSRKDSSTIPRTYRLKSREPQDVIGLNSPLSHYSRLPKFSQDTRSSKPICVTRDTSASRLPTHFIPMQSSTRNSTHNQSSKPHIKRAQSLRPPDLPPSAPPTSGNTATRSAVNYLRCTLPRLVKGEHSEEELEIKGPFGYSHS